MKRLKAGAVNSISFIKSSSYTINSFEVIFEKVVGGTVLTLSDIQDELGLSSCSDFMVLNIDLLSNTIDGGEYYMTINNAGGSTSYLCEVQSYQYNTHGTDIYSDSVVLSNEVTSDVTGDVTGEVSLYLLDNFYPNAEIYLNTSFVEYIQLATDGLDTNTEYLYEAEITDSDNNVEVFSRSQKPNVQFNLDISNTQLINFGDVADIKFRVKQNGVVLGETSTYTLLIPPKIEAAVGLTKAEADTKILDGVTEISIGRYESKEPPSISTPIANPMDYLLWTRVLENKSSKIYYTNESVGIYGNEFSKKRDAISAPIEHTPSGTNVLEKVTYYDSQSNSYFDNVSNLFELESTYGAPEDTVMSRVFELHFTWEKNGITYATPYQEISSLDKTYLPYSDKIVSFVVNVSEYENYETAFDNGTISITGSMPLEHKGSVLYNNDLYIYLGNWVNNNYDLLQDKILNVYLEIRDTNSVSRFVTLPYGDSNLSVTSGITLVPNGPTDTNVAVTVIIKNQFVPADTYCRIWIEYGLPTLKAIHNVDNGTGFTPQYHFVGL
jgi:hypothetical protein